MCRCSSEEGQREEEPKQTSLDNLNQAIRTGSDTAESEGGDEGRFSLRCIDIVSFLTRLKPDDLTPPSSRAPSSCHETARESSLARGVAVALIDRQSISPERRERESEI
jgi:hypothetical protein